LFDRNSEKDKIDRDREMQKLMRQKCSGALFKRVGRPLIVEAREGFLKTISGDVLDWLQTNTEEQIKQQVERYLENYRL
jgi:hypothetical protein